jgi:predicted RNA-binding Zn-ribbon protein involved in translation (DUF1610 family)
VDELDRMYRRLVENIREGFPDLLTEPFEVATLHQHLIPYPLNRTELGTASVDEYELTLMRLLSGARGLLIGDQEMQAALLAELQTANPDLSAFRAFATSKVALAPGAQRGLDSANAPVPGISVRPPGANGPTPAPRHADVAGRETQEVATPAASGEAVPPRPAPGAGPTRPASDGGCRYCGAELPEGRDVHFCPHCGQNLTIRQCPACSTELEVGWQYCIQCGRQVE